MELNNAVYEPLAMSNSDSCREEIIPSFRKKKRFRKKSSLGLSQNSEWKSSSRMGSKLWIVFVSVCFVWLILLTWFAVSLHFQSNILKGLLREVAAGSQGVPDALQKCHSWSRQLQANQTLLFAHLGAMSRHLENITSQIGTVQSGLTHVEEKLTSSPELINVPHEVQDLSASVASFGSQIQDLQTSFNKIKEEQSNVLKLINSMKSNVTSINDTLNDFSKIYNTTKDNISESTYTEKIEKALNGVNSKLNNINETITRKVNWILEDQHKDNMAIQSLEESRENISSRITTLQNSCMSVDLISTKTDNVSSRVLQQEQRLNDVQSQMRNMINKINIVEESSSKIVSDITDLKTLLPPHRIIEDDNLANSSIKNPMDKVFKLTTNGTQSDNNEND